MGHNSVVSSHAKSTRILRVDGLSTGPPDLGRHKLSLIGRDQHVSASNRDNWLTIWNLKLPPRIKIFF